LDDLISNQNITPDNYKKIFRCSF